MSSLLILKKMERQLDDAFGYARGNAFFWCAKLYPWMMAHFLLIGETHVRARAFNCIASCQTSLLKTICYMDLPNFEHKMHPAVSINIEFKTPRVF